MAKKVALPVVQYDESLLDPDAQTSAKGIVCEGCQLEKKPRVAGAGAAGGDVDIMLVSESPSTWSTSNKQLFYGRGGRIIRQTWKMFVDADGKSGGGLGFKHLKKWETYAIQCQVEASKEQSATIPKAVIEKCSHYLKSAVKITRGRLFLTALLR
jgi:uracil-DNA glycosylase